MNHKTLIVLTLRITAIWMLPMQADLQPPSIVQHQETSMTSKESQQSSRQLPVTLEEPQQEPQLSMTFPMQPDMQRLQRPTIMTQQQQATMMTSEESEKKSRQLSMMFPLQPDLQRLQGPSMMTQQQQAMMKTSLKSQKEPQQLSMMFPTQPDLQRLQNPSTITKEESQEEARQLPMTSQLQQQLLALQQWQAMQKLNTIHAPSTLYLPQPFMVLLPNPPLQDKEDANAVEETGDNEDENKNKSNNKEYIDKALESVIIDAENMNDDHYEVKAPQRAVLLVPHSRFSIGQIISAIPWLPFEVNVPDTVAWAWNGISSGISGIISIIGQRLPFRPRQQIGMMTKTQGANVKMFLNQLQMKPSMMPVLVLPFQRPVITMELL